MLRLWVTLLLLLFTAACNLPETPQELAERVALAAMEANEEDLAELLTPASEGGKLQGLSARSLRLKYQGFAFHAAPEPASASASGRHWNLELSISGTGRKTPAIELAIDCGRSEGKSKTICLLTDLRELDWRFDDLTSVERETMAQDETPRVWLMTSLDVLDPTLNLFTGRNHEILSRAEHLFQDWASREAPFAKPVIAHLATQHEMARVLLDRRTLAVFWVSHGASGAVLDYRGFELAPALKGLFSRSQAARVALISCSSKGILEDPDRVIDFEKKIDLTEALSEALERTPGHVLKPQISEMDSGDFPGETIELVRTLRAMPLIGPQRQVTPALRVELKDDIVATLPGLRPWQHADTRQSLSFRVPLPATRVILTAGENYLLSLEEIRLGDWEILTPGWKFFSDAQGKPIGVTRNIVLRDRQR